MWIGEQIGGGEADQPPAGIAVSDDSTDNHWMSQQFIGCVDIALFHQVSNARAADAVASGSFQRKNANVQVVFLRVLFQEGDIAHTVATKTKVLAHHQAADSKVCQRSEEHTS